MSFEDNLKVETHVNKDLLGSTYIRDIQPIQESDSLLQSKSDIAKLVEPPLIPACEQLYDLNICTWRSSANFQDIKQGYGVISIDYPSLSERNKAIAERLIQEGKGVLQLDNYGEAKLVTLVMPLTSESTLDEVSAQATSLTNQFKKQRMTWEIHYSLARMRQIEKRHGRKDFDTVDVETLIREHSGLYYDRETQTFYVNEEQCLKAKEVIDDTD